MIFWVAKSRNYVHLWRHISVVGPRIGMGMVYSCSAPNSESFDTPLANFQIHLPGYDHFGPYSKKLKKGVTNQNSGYRLYVIIMLLVTQVDGKTLITFVCPVFELFWVGYKMVISRKMNLKIGKWDIKRLGITCWTWIYHPHSDTRSDIQNMT